MSSLLPRVVLVTRDTEYDGLLKKHSTRGQSAFYLKSRKQRLSNVEARHGLQQEAVNTAKNAIPEEWTLAQVLRDDLDRFLFGPNDIVVAIGQDGLVANLAKYLSGQPVVGVAPDPQKSEGVLTTWSPNNLAELLPSIANKEPLVQCRAMVAAEIDQSQTLFALNELFIGHRSHQSARYILRHEGREEVQSSSGVIFATGTGLTGWAKSVLLTTHRQAEFKPEDKKAVFLAREPWPSRTTGNALSFGMIESNQNFEVVSRMNEGGVIFADGIEQDFLSFNYGMSARFSIASRTLNLVVG